MCWNEWFEILKMLWRVNIWEDFEKELRYGVRFKGYALFDINPKHHNMQFTCLKVSLLFSNNRANIKVVYEMICDIDMDVTEK